MKISALADILGGDCKSRHVSALSREDREVFLQCLNGAILEWCALAPSWARRSPPLPYFVHAPFALTVTFTNGSSTVSLGSLSGSGHATAATLVGCTLVTGSYRARFVSTTALDAVWSGASGAQSCTVYTDAIQLGPTWGGIESVVALQDGRERQLIGASEEEMQVLAERQETGDPLRWCASALSPMTADATTGSAAFVVRLQPMPSRALSLRVERISRPALLTHADLRGDAQFNMADAQVVAAIIPLAREQIAASALARDGLDKQAIATQAQRARAATMTGGNQHFSMEAGRVRTRPGF